MEEQQTQETLIRPISHAPLPACKETQQGVPCGNVQLCADTAAESTLMLILAHISCRANATPWEGA